jgi:hypothetical protein
MDSATIKNYLIKIACPQCPLPSAPVATGYSGSITNQAAGIEQSRHRSVYMAAYASAASRYATRIPSPPAAAMHSLVRDYSGANPANFLEEALKSQFWLLIFWFLRNIAFPALLVLFLYNAINWQDWLGITIEELRETAAEAIRLSIIFALRTVVQLILLPFNIIAATLRAVVAISAFFQLRQHSDHLAGEIDLLYIRLRYNSVTDKIYLRYQEIRNFLGRHQLHLGFAIFWLWLFSDMLKRKIMGDTEMEIAPGVAIPAAFWRHKAIHEGLIRGCEI